MESLCHHLNSAALEILPFEVLRCSGQAQGRRRFAPQNDGERHCLIKREGG